MSPAIFKGEDWTGKTVGDWVVVGGYDDHVTTTGKHYKRWVVRCKCGLTVVRFITHFVYKNVKSCLSCKGRESRGKKSSHWIGGEYVPGFFIAHVKSKCARGTRSLEFDVSYSYLDDLWVKQKGKCVYTGRTLNFGGAGQGEQTASLDRIDSSRGYIEGNVQFVHKNINIMKWQMSHSDFINACREIVEWTK